MNDVESIEDLFDTPDPWRKRVYWAVFRFFKNNDIFHPMSVMRRCRWFIQRGRRGWADCDTWSLDSYLIGWLPAALRHLARHTHGVPMSMFTAEDCGDDGQPKPGTHDIAVQRWADTLEKMAVGFEALERAHSGVYEAELGEYPLYRPSNVPKDVWRAKKAARFEASNKLTLADRERFKEGMGLFVEHFESLWD